MIFYLAVGDHFGGVLDVIRLLIANVEPCFPTQGPIDLTKVGQSLMLCVKSSGLNSFIWHGFLSLTYLAIVWNLS